MHASNIGRVIVTKRKRELRARSGRLIVLGMMVVLQISAASVRGVSAARRASPQGSQSPAPSGRQTSDDAFEILPERVLQHITRGGELSRLRRYDEAIEEYRAAIKEAGKPVFTAYLNMGTVSFSKEDYPQAIEAFKQALTLRPNSWQGHYNLAEALFAREDYSGAEKEYRRVLELPSNQMATRTRHFLGLALYKQGRVDEAMVEYRSAIEQAGGQYSEAHYNLGIALLERGQAQIAEQEFKLALEQEKKPWPEAQYNLAQALEKQKRFTEAADGYEVYLKLAPDAPDAKKMREYIQYLRRKK
jgi:tetratricopeptide (TPR) repeat protein